MYNSQYETTLVSQLLDSINDHLKTIHLPMESNEYEMSVDNSDDDELSLSGHRSIFSSYGSHHHKTALPRRESQYEGFYWDLYENCKYHHLAFEQDNCPTTSLSEWSMHLSSNDADDDTTSSSDPPRTSWHAIKTQSIHLSCSLSSANTSDSDHRSDSPITLYHLFQRRRSKQHPCRLYENFSDKSLCDSLTSSSSSTSCSNSIKYEYKIPMPRIKLKSPTTFSQLKLNNHHELLSSTKTKKQSIRSNQTIVPRHSVDQCLQTSDSISQTDNLFVTRSKSADRVLNNPIQPSLSSSTSHQSLPIILSLPNLDFLTYYAKENPTPLSPPLSQIKYFSTPMKNILSEQLSLTKKSIRTIFYCSIKIPSSTVQKARTLKEIKRIKTNPTIKSTKNTFHNLSSNIEETGTFSSICSSTENSTSSSGYFSNSSTNQPRNIQTTYPLKSCLKRTKTKDLTSPLTIANVLAIGVAGDIFTLAARLGDNKTETSQLRRYSSPTISSHKQNLSFQFRTRNKTCTLSEHDLQTKKSVSFCDNISRRLITPSTSPKHQLPSYQDYCDNVPRESLIDSPPNEFNLSDIDDDDNNQLINFIEDAPEDITKPLPIKYGSDKYLIDAFSNTILHILEIKCNDPQSDYLNNITNQELDRILRQDLCLLLREVLEDGLRQHPGSLFSKKVNLWRLIDLTTPTVGRFNEAKMKVQLSLSSSADWNEKFNAFIYHLLNLHELAAWLTHFLSHRILFKTYYESWAFVLVHVNNDLFECITNQLEKLSPLSFRLKYMILSNSKIFITNQRSANLGQKKFNVRAWLRERKSQVKIPPTKSLTNISIRRKFSSIPVNKT